MLYDLMERWICLTCSTSCCHPIYKDELLFCKPLKTQTMIFLTWLTLISKKRGCHRMNALVSALMLQSVTRKHCRFIACVKSIMTEIGSNH